MTARPPIKELSIDLIEATTATQMRASVRPNLVKDYADDLKSGAFFPPVIVFADDGSERYILADGFHRLAAAKLCGYDSIACAVHTGGMREALTYALGSNADNGERRTNNDKRHAVQMALKDPEWTAWSNTDIGRLCRVSDKLVASVREELVVKGHIEKQETVKTSQGGKTVERKATTTKGSTSRTDKKKKKKQQDKTIGRAKTQDEKQLQEAREGIDLIISIPHDGTEAHRRWGPAALAKAQLAYDWLGEYLAAAKENAA